MKHSIKLYSGIILLAMIAVLSSKALAAVPQTLSYQGLLKDAGGTVIPDGTYDVTFRIYNVPAGGAALWTETQSVQVRDGVFSAVLGIVNPLTLPFDAFYWISIRVAPDPELPRVVLTSAPYALRAAVADSVVGGGGGGGDITAVYADQGLLGGATTGDAHVRVGGGAGISVTADAVAVDGAAVAGAGLTAEGPSAVAVNPGTGLAVAADQVQLTVPYASGSAYDGRFVNEAQGNSVTADMIVPDVVGSVDGVANDAGNIDLVAGENVTITPDNVGDTITIAATGSGVAVAAYTSGSCVNPTANVQFLSPAVTVTISAVQRIFVSANRAFGTTVVGGANNLDLYIGYRVAGSGAVPTTVGGGMLNMRLPQDTRVPMGISAVISGLGAGSYEVGMAGDDDGNGNWNNNEWGYTSALVLTPSSADETDPEPEVRRE